MGIIFGKSKNKLSAKVTEYDKAVLQLKQQRDKVKQYQKRIASKLENERLIAQKLLRNGQKDKALLLLKKKKYFESLMIKADNQLVNLEQLVDSLEFGQIQAEVVSGLKRGNEALKELHQLLSIDQIESILEETQEGIAKQKEIENIIAKEFGEQEGLNEELEKELAEMIEEPLSNLPQAPQEPLPDIQSYKFDSPIKKSKPKELVTAN